MNKTVLIATTILVTACNPSLRKSDGVVGYEASQQGQETFITYTEDKKYGWPFVEGRAREACGVVTSGNGVVNVEIVDRKTVVKDIAIPVPGIAVSYAGGGTVSGGGLKNNLGGPTTSTSNLDSLVRKELYQVKMRCGDAHRAAP